MTRKLGRPLEPEQALAAVEYFQAYPVVEITAGQVSDAIRRSIARKISLWDALIVESALAARVDCLVSEDLQDGWKINSMEVWNPFKA